MRPVWSIRIKFKANEISNDVESDFIEFLVVFYRYTSSGMPGSRYTRNDGEPNGQLSMITSSNDNIFRVNGHLCGNSPVSGEFPAQRPVTRSFDIFFDQRLNKRLNKQSWGWWFETLSCPFWRHCNATSELLLLPAKFQHTPPVDA